MKARVALIIFGCLLLLAAIMMPPMCRFPKNRIQITSCVHSLWTWRKVMEMYANDHQKSWYPKELNDRAGSPEDVKLLNAVGAYTNITSTLNSCAQTVFSSVTLSNYTITAIAKDESRTLLTATPDTIMQP